MRSVGKILVSLQTGLLCLMLGMNCMTPVAASGPDKVAGNHSLNE